MQSVRHLLFAVPPKAAAELQRRQDVGPPSGEQLDIVGQVVGLIEVPTHQHHRPAQLRLHARDHRGDAASPQPGGGGGAGLTQGAGEIADGARSNKPPD